MAVAEHGIPAATLRMIAGMKKRVTVSVEEEILEAAKAEVTDGVSPNLSAAVESALLQRARSRALDALLDDFAAHHPGEPLTDAERTWARDALGGRDRSTR